MKKFIIIFFLILKVDAIALIEVDITRGNLNPLPVAVSPLSIDDNSKKSFKKMVRSRWLLLTRISSKFQWSRINKYWSIKRI